MDYLPRGVRVWSIDLIRGFYLFLLILAHSIFFFHNAKNVLLVGVNTLADTICFTGLVFISGCAAYIAYVGKASITPKSRLNLLKRLFSYLLGYFALALFADFVINGWNLDRFRAILLFHQLVPFTEFIITFILLGLIQVPLRRLLQIISSSWLFTFTSGFLLYSTGAILSHYPWAEALSLPVGWQAILTGLPGWFSFPLLQYFAIYLVGLHFGYLLIHDELKRIIISKLALVASFCLLIVLVSFALAYYDLLPFTTIFNRFPPTLPFLMAGLAVVTLLWLISFHGHRIRQVNSFKVLLLILGQNTFLLFFTHSAILYGYIALGFPVIHSTILLLILWLLSLFLALTLSKFIPLNYKLGLNFIAWCECQAGSCVHDSSYHETELKKTWRLLRRAFDLGSFRVGRRVFRLARARHIAAGMALLLAVAAPLGIAENDLLIRNSLEDSSGSLNRKWILTQYDNAQLQYTYSLPSHIESPYEVYYQIDDGQITPMSRHFQAYSSRIDTSSLAPGEYNLRPVIKRGEIQYRGTPSTFFVSAPVYVTWTIDWEGYDANQGYMDAMVNISDQYRMPMTQMFNPRIYTNPEISESRAEYLTTWVRNRRDVYGEEIGLHLHMFPDFIEASGIVPKLEPVWGGGFSYGYDILTTAYTREEMVSIIDHAKAVFREKNLGEPKSYRAGAWFANLDTLRALEDTGFWVDSSGRTAYNFGTLNLKGPWDLSAAAQPYFPSLHDQNAPGTDNLHVLEIPNNGADSFAFSAEELISRFINIYSGGVVYEKKQITYLSHPHWFHQQRQAKMRQVFEHIENYRYDLGNGPVVPTNLIGIYNAWTNP